MGRRRAIITMAHHCSAVAPKSQLFVVMVQKLVCAVFLPGTPRISNSLAFSSDFSVDALQS